MLNILFICVHNSARSQIAEELLRQKLGDQVQVYSAGLEPGNLNPVVVDILKEMGIDISGKQTRSVFDFIKQNIRFHYVVTVCDETSGERCPIFPGFTKRLHWTFPDPSSFQGTYEQKKEKTLEIVQMIDEKLEDFIIELQPFLL